jgi:very-short-patch-repair endonuclease
MSKAEVVLWKKLSRKQLLGFKFRRQYGVDQYVIDFYCPKLKLAIEVDGESHFVQGAEDYDRRRQEHIESLGITFLRFTNTDIYENLNGVLQSIAEKAEELST